MIKNILVMTARIEGKTEAMMVELAKYKAKENGTTQMKELVELQEAGRVLGRNLLEQLYKMPTEPAPKPFKGLL